LQEAADADLLLHVVDAANTNYPEQIAQVQLVLQEIGAAQVPQVLVFNKTDALAPGQQPRHAKDFFELEGSAVPRLFVSGRTLAGVPELRRQLALEVNRRQGAGTLSREPAEIHETPA
jgi:GTP-binding protein HflX